MKIQQQRPILPNAKKLAPYLKDIDDSRYYSNGGPMVIEYEEKLSELFSAPAIACSSCTSGITACLIALELPPGSLVACPSWTFVATAAAIVAAGHTPYFFDVGANWAINYFKGVKAAILVAPFGAPVDDRIITDFIGIKGIPIIIDAAAGFDSFSSICKVGNCPVVISTHATKVFGTGEGGIVLSQNKEFLEKVRSVCNFGLPDCKLPGINAKMSEYHAAVGLAELEGWEEKRLRWLGVKHAYMEEFRNITLDSPIMDVRWVGNAFPIRLNRVIPILVEQMIDAGIMCKQWTPVHRKKAYSEYPLTILPVTNELAETTMLLPFSVDQTLEEIEYIRGALCAFL